MFRIRAILVGHSSPPDLDRASHDVRYFEGKSPAMRRPNRHKFGMAAQPHMELVKTADGFAVSGRVKPHAHTAGVTNFELFGWAAVLYSAAPKSVGFAGRAGSWEFIRFENPSRRVGDPWHCMGTKAKPLAHAMPLAALLSLSRVQPPRGRIAYPFPAEDEHE
jgi:hypothetical protein